jgi:hypothetical protein
LSSRVARAPLEGGEEETLAEEQESPDYLVVDESHVYWATFSQLLRVAK